MRYLITEPCSSGMTASTREELHEIIDELLDQDEVPDTIEINCIEID